MFELSFLFPLSGTGDKYGESVSKTILLISILLGFTLSNDSNNNQLTLMIYINSQIKINFNVFNWRIFMSGYLRYQTIFKNTIVFVSEISFYNPVRDVNASE